MMSLQDAATMVKGKAGGGNPTFTGVSTDTRTVRAGEIAVDHGRDRTCALCLIEKGMAVEALAAQRDKQLARLHRPRIGRDAFENGVAAARLPFHHGRGVLHAHHRFPRIATAARTAAASENGSRLPAISW